MKFLLIVVGFLASTMSVVQASSVDSLRAFVRDSQMYARNFRKRFWIVTAAARAKLLV